MSSVSGTQDEGVLWNPVINARAERLLVRGVVRDAARALVDTDARTLREQRELTEIPAPPYGEGPRAARMGELMMASGLAGVETDQEGNVTGWIPGDEEGHPLVVSAHLDTVFPPGTDVRVRREGDRLLGPGISDDGRGLAALLALARALVTLRVRLNNPVLLAATVGEEGNGDLRGVRHLFREGGAARGAAGFVSLDGAGLNRIVATGLGVRRFRATVRGPGGHSWVNWGTANPIHALGHTVARLSELPLPDEPRATLTVSRWAGGTSINVIPREASADLEVRCVSEEVLERLSEQVQSALESSVADVNHVATQGTASLTLELTAIGQRPAGQTDPSARLVLAAAAATLALGGSPELVASSTDANVPMALGIPALTMGAGGVAGRAHTTDEWYSNENGPRGILRALLTLLLADDD